ncbi:PAS domain-containing protein [Cupriavidus necator]
MLTNCRVFSDATEFCVRGVTLSETNDPSALREKFGRVIVDDMYQFVGLLDVNGMILEINRAAVESFGIRMDQVRGTPFWDADW